MESNPVEMNVSSPPNEKETIISLSRDVIIQGGVLHYGEDRRLNLESISIQVFFPNSIEDRVNLTVRGSRLENSAWVQDSRTWTKLEELPDDVRVIIGSNIEELRSMGRASIDSLEANNFDRPKLFNLEAIAWWRGEFVKLWNHYKTVS